MQHRRNIQRTRLSAVEAVNGRGMSEGGRTNQTSTCVTLLVLQPIPNADFIVPVEIDGTVHQVYVLKRPYVDEFLQKMGELFECVLFTASLAKVRSLHCQSR